MNDASEALLFCHRLRDGAARISRQQFRNCLKRSIGANKDYADGVFISFQNNPAAFLAHRNPQSQSIELIRKIFELTPEHQPKAEHVDAPSAESAPPQSPILIV